MTEVPNNRKKVVLLASSVLSVHIVTLAWMKKNAVYFSSSILLYSFLCVFLQLSSVFLMVSIVRPKDNEKICLDQK